MPKCKSCKATYERKQDGQVVCSYQCGIEYAKKNKEKREKKAKTQANKERLAFKKTDKKTLKELAQKLFNQYIRERDKELACISCGTTNDIQYHAGHFKPAGGFSYLRFDENNVHKQCVRCNSYLAGNLVPYREALIEKVGLDEVERLEKPNQRKVWTVEEYQEIIKTYRKKLKDLLD